MRRVGILQRLMFCGCYAAIAIGCAACAPKQTAQVVDRKVLTQRELDERIGGELIRVVQRGDTLYSIAFATGLDVNKVAAWNGISDTSKLSAGQRVRLTQPPNFKPPSKTITVVKPDTARVAKRTRVISEPKPATPKPVKSERAVTKKPDQTKISKSQVKAPVSKNKPANNTPVSNDVRWAWPFRGTIVARYNPRQGQQGINIQGQRGQAVKASASGEVVYAGDSLKGYGNLIIIKHSSEFLSAYAYNQSILVTEGQKVKQGETIARLGNNTFGRAVAQFQIRKNGNPVDPSKYLF